MSEHEHEDEDLRRLAALPGRGLSADEEARLRRRPRAVFAREAAAFRSPWVAAIGRLYFRLEPAGVGVIVLAYLGWAVQTAFGLLR